jgi:hypothetical protein
MLTISPKTTRKDAPPLDLTRWRLDGRLSKLVAQRFYMDNDEAVHFALACGCDLSAMAGHEPFDRHLRSVILRYRLTDLFGDVGDGPHHHTIKPIGFDNDADAVIPEVMAQWRAAYRALPEAHQIIAATIIWLYRGGPDVCVRLQTRPVSLTILVRQRAADRALA